jgi:hypothetical protein
LTGDLRIFASSPIGGGGHPAWRVIRLSGVLHVVTQLIVTRNPLNPYLEPTVNAYLPPSDVTAVDRQGNEYLTYGAGTVTGTLTLVDLIPRPL